MQKLDILDADLTLMEVPGYIADGHFDKAYELVQEAALLTNTMIKLHPNDDELKRLKKRVHDMMWEVDRAKKRARAARIRNERKSRR